MDCHVPVDDLCFASEARSLQIFKEIPRSDDHNLEYQFLIKINLDMICPFAEYEEEEVDFLEVELRGRTTTRTFRKPCPRLERDNLSRETISSMLSEAGVPLHKQEHMVHIVSAEADQIATAAYNKDKKVLGMLVDVSIIACYCCADQMDDADIGVLSSRSV